jgi:hypothetical protein
MSNPITRRTALAGAGALPLLPATALATETSVDAELLRLGAELDQAWAREKALIDSEAWGDAYEAAFNACSAIAGQIEKQQAHTLDGFRVKARAVMWCQQWGEVDPFSLSEHPTTDIRLAESIILDLVGVAS